MSIAHPLRLILALLVALAVLGVASLAQRNRTRGALAYSNLEFMIASAGPKPWIGRALAAGGIVGVLLVAVAFAGPALALPVPVKDGAVFLCVDTSGSMGATDVAPTRAQAAQSAARAFAVQTPAGTRIGLITFSSSAQMLAPLTRDRDRLDAAIAAIPPPNGATAIGEALALAGAHLPAGKHRVIVLITDGVNNRGADPLAVAQGLGRRGVAIYTIGIGTSQGGLIAGTGDEATIDEDALRSYAQGGGTYARVGSASALRDALAGLGRITGLQRERVDMSFACAACGAALLVAVGVLGLAWGRFP